MRIEVRAADLQLKYTFKTSRSEVQTSRSYFLTAQGAVGEASPVRFYGDTHAGIEAAIAELSQCIDSWQDPRRLWPRLDRALGYNFAAKCGLDLLLWDHLGQSEGAPVRELLDITTERPLVTSLTVGIGTPKEMQAQVRQNSEFKIFKLKVGFENDMAAVRAVREATDAPLYVDANGGWSVSEACSRLPELEGLGVVLCEQPIFSGNREDWRRLGDSAGIPVIVDEYCQRPADVAHWAGWVDGINVKLQKTGGITPALAMIRCARELGLKVMLGCMIESSVGIAAAAQLAPLADYLDLDSHLYLASDPYSGIACPAGELQPSALPGLGVQKREATS